MEDELHTILSAGGRATPQETQAVLSLGEVPGTVRVKIKLPGATTFSDLGNLPILNGTIRLPVPFVFIAHTVEDRDAVGNLANRLWNDGFLVWIDTRDLLAGDDWERAIDQALQQADFALLVLSKCACEKRGQFQRELRYALRQAELVPPGSRYVIPALLEPCDPPQELLRFHWVKLWEPNAYAHLCHSLRKFP